MDQKMFCYQCQETAGCKGCTVVGVCGKQPDVAAMQDLLVWVTKGISAVTTRLREEGRAVADEVNHLVTENLFTTITNANFDKAAIEKRIEKTLEMKTALWEQLERRDNLPEAAGWTGEPSEFIKKASEAGVLIGQNEDIISLRSLITYGLKGLSAYTRHANVLLQEDREADAFLQRALAATLDDGLSVDDLIHLTLETGEYGVRGMALLDRANTETYGNPVPTQVPLTVEKGPFIVISGHDLYDLKQLLEQTKDKGINIYTHGEMLPAHAYPELKKYPHLKGNFGTAWQNQQKEFAALPAPVLFTTNCLMPPKASYADRVFTTSVVSYPELVHIGEEKDFTPVIEKALELGGYAVDRPFTGINGGSTVMTGFARGAVLSAADTVIEAVKSGAIRHFFLVAGCDGARPGRNYYTEFVKQTPADTVVLTLACGKYRFNDLDLGTIGGLPRLMDVGQCNDAYSAIQIALALANAFGCGVNELPLSMVLSWYEQKAVCILLTLLHLGIRNIRLGPTLPAFLSPNVLNYLVDNFGIAPITTPEADLKQLLK